MRGLQRENCVLLVGPEIDAAIGTMPLTKLLARHLAQGCTGPLVDPTNLADVARQYGAEFGRNTLESEVVDFYNTQREPTAAHRDLAALPFHFVLTSCHDQRLQAAFSAVGKRPRTASYSQLPARATALVPQGTVSDPLVFHLFGTLAQPRSMVLTENNLLSFLISVARKDPPLPTNVSSELQRADRSFLFLGFGIKQWHWRILLHLFEVNRSENRSFAFEPFEAEELPRLADAVFYYRTGYRIEVFNVTVAQFIRELRSRWQAAQPIEHAADPQGVELPVAPAVFISYASADHAAAHLVFDALSAAGMDVWMDRHRLEGGDRWDEVIQHNLLDADYCVLLYSEQMMLRNPFGYIFKEINLALEKQRNAKPGTRFLIPMLLDDSNIEMGLEGIQAVRFEDGAGVDNVIRTIRRDFQRRARYGRSA